MGTRADEQELDGLTPYQRMGYVEVVTEESITHLARNEYEGLEIAILQKKNVFIGRDNRGNTVLIRLRRGVALTVDSVTDWTAEALAAQLAETEANKFKNGEG